MTYYHARVLRASDKKSFFLIDAEEPILRERLIDPYANGQPIVLEGTTLREPDLEQVMVATSAVSFKDLEERAREQDRRSSVLVLGWDIRYSAFQLADNVTDQYIYFAYGSRAAPSSAATLGSSAGFSPRNIFVVHGRDGRARQSMFEFLRSVDLNPIEWNEAKAETGQGSPYVGDVVKAGFRMAQAAVILFTPDDMASLKEEFHKKGDQPYERVPTGQARPNVIFEAGYAMSTFESRTVLVELGTLRPLSDLIGRAAIRLSDSTAKRQELLDALLTCGCEFSYQHRTAWHTAGKFDVSEQRE